MKLRVLLAIFLLSTILTFAQRPAYRPPAYKPPPYKPTTRPGELGKGYGGSTHKEFSTGPSSWVYEAFAKSDKVSSAKHVVKYEALKSIIGSERFEALKKSATEYEIAYENGKYEVLHCGEIVTKKFSFTENNNSITIKPNSTLKNERIELVFDEYVWKKGKKINAKNIALKMLAKNGETYEVERVTIENGEVKYMANIKEGIWIEPSKSDVEIVNKNLERQYNKDLVKIISIVRDYKTDKVLKDEVGSKSLICKTKKDLMSRINEQKEGSTIFIIGHHERGRFVTHSEKGEVLFELSATEINKVSKEKNINIFPLGCKTAFSEFSEGANIDLNSVKLVQSLSKSLNLSNTFGELLQNITKLESSLRFLIENNSFGAIKVEVLKETKTNQKAEGYPQKDSSNIYLRRVISTKSINTTKIASGYIFTEPDSSYVNSYNYLLLSSPINDFQLEEDYTKYEKKEYSLLSKIGIYFATFLFLGGCIVGSYYENNNESKSCLFFIISVLGLLLAWSIV